MDAEWVIGYGVPSCFLIQPLLCAPKALEFLPEKLLQMSHIYVNCSDCENFALSMVDMLGRSNLPISLINPDLFKDKGFIKLSLGKKKHYKIIN